MSATPELRFSSERDLRAELDGLCLLVSPRHTPMPLTRRAILRFGAAGALATLLSACGPSVAPTVPPATPVGVPKVGPQVEITYLVRNDLASSWNRWVDMTISEFQGQNPGVRVNTVGVPWAEYNSRLLAMYAAGTPPEISANYAAGFATFQINRAITPLDDYVAAENLDMSLFDRRVREALTREGKLWALPLDHYPTVIFYNRDLYEKDGLKLPPVDWADRSWTTDALLDNARKLAKDTTDPTKAVFGLNAGTAQLGITSWLWDGDPFNNQGGPEFTEAYKTGVITQVHYNGPKMLATLTWLADLILRDRVAPRPADTQALQQMVTWAFLTGRVAMDQQILYNAISFLTVATPFRWGIAPLPYGPGGRNTNPLFNDSWMLGAKCKQPQEGFAFLKYLAFGNGARLYAAFSGCLPANRNLYPVWFDAMMKTNCGMTRADLEKAVVPALDYGFETPGKTLDRFPDLSKVYGQAVAPIWTGERSVQDALDACQKGFEVLIKRP